MEKKQACITVLILPPIPQARATLCASITKRRTCRSMILRWIGSGRCSQTSSGPNGVLSKKVPPGMSGSITSIRSRNRGW